MNRFSRRAIHFCAGFVLATTVQAAAVVPPSITAGFVNTANATSPLGTNLTAVTDFAAEYPFVNFMRQARPWFSAPSDFSGFQDNQPLDLDANGNIRSLAPTQFARTVLFDGLPPDPGIAGRRLHLYYAGEGEFFYNGATRNDELSTPGHDVLDIVSPAPDEFIRLVVTMASTNPQNPVRNIRLVPPGGICADNPTVTVASARACPQGNFLSFQRNADRIVFHPQFLASVARFRSLRFMDWMRTNNSAQTGFSTRALPGNAVWSTEKGVPLEVMIALANLMDIDPWFNIPHRATNAYVTAFATLLKNQLEPGRRAYIEYSNEVWNPQFAQTGFAQRQGVLAGINTLEGNRDDFAGMLHFYSRRSRQIHEIVGTVFGAERATRIRRVMATQSVNSFLTQEILNFENAAAATDVFAIAPYFGDTITDQARRDELLRLGVDGVFDWLLNDNNAILDFGSLASINGFIDAQVDALEPFGIPLTSYEGGQHFLAAGAFQFDPELNALMDAVNRDPRMKTVYRLYLEGWQARTGNVFHHYLNVDRWGEFGRWGAREFPTQTRANAPKHDALQAFITAKPLVTLP